MIKKLFIVFIAAFFLNWVWEELHSVLYIHYQGGAITAIHLLRAAFVDATFIVAAAAVFFSFQALRQRLWLIVPLGVAAAIVLEWFALSTGRWSYNELMPIIPVLKTGLTPTIQLGFTGYIAFKLSEVFAKKKTAPPL